MNSLNMLSLTTRRTSVLALVGLVCSGCATTESGATSSLEQGEESRASTGSGSTETGDALAGEGAGSMRAGVQDASARREPSRQDVEDTLLAIFASPEWKRRFAESYLAESDIEPRVLGEEGEVLGKVQEMLSEGELDDALGLLNRWRDDKASAVFDFLVGNIHFQREELPEAVQAFEIAVGKFSKYRRAWESLGQVHYRRAEFGPATDAFARVLELGGGNSVTYGLLGVCHIRQEQPIAAESAFRMAAMLAPTKFEWKLGLAESYFKQRRFRDAVALFDTLLEERPDDPALWSAQGQAYAQLKEMGRAAENFEMASQLGGATVASLNNLGDIYAQEGLYDLAVMSYLRALRSSPEASLDRAMLAARFLAGNEAHLEAGKLVDGIEQERGGRLTEDEQKDLLRLKAGLAVASGDDEAQARELEKVLQLDPLDGDALILLGQYYERKARAVEVDLDEEGNDRNEGERNLIIEKAINYFENAAAMERFVARASLRHGQMLVRLGDYAKAIEKLERAQQLDPQDNVERFLKEIKAANGLGGSGPGS